MIQSSHCIDQIRGGTKPEIPYWRNNKNLLWWLYWLGNAKLLIIDSISSFCYLHTDSSIITAVSKSRYIIATMSVKIDRAQGKQSPIALLKVSSHQQQPLRRTLLSMVLPVRNSQSFNGNAYYCEAPRHHQFRFSSAVAAIPCGKYIRRTTTMNRGI